jgi:hypothetical protein
MDDRALPALPDVGFFVSSAAIRMATCWSSWRRTEPRQGGVSGSTDCDDLTEWALCDITPRCQVVSMGESGSPQR